MNLRNNLLSGSIMMRGPQVCFAPENDSGGGGDNGGGNSGTQEKSAETPDNAGGAFDPTKFWDKPPANALETPGKPGSVDSTGKQVAPAEESEGTKIGKTFSERLTNLNLGGPIFTDDIMAKAAEGDVKGLNDAISAQSKAAVQHAVMMSAELMKAHQDVMLSRVQTMIQEALGGRDKQQTLESEFPQLASNPAMRPMIQGIFDKAMENSKGDRAAAVSMTRTMLQYMGKEGSKDFGFKPPQEDGDMTENSRSLVEQLLDRG